ncbi:hypothetical protein CEUSTIGMA_g11148.t1 [Chlamydomonas eustigma]|uniref:Uncharacterized protein n=1 Tax=Chlamydomonas eustigma TaxID=1157962 RepID=A0A250XL20_9CHLO|nr:hypothetical protein CEUSTIGMA_g11148.t1 [Chlamydomonas eustigma]|eukprot:GAX83723.1 hypothetical protein CEUSTIGMA_g11148.t1 [Chlamydomonas eustigma]
MPRVAVKTNRASQKDRLDRCIDALLQNPDAACVGGSELCCGGCGSGGELVEGLAAFVSHSSAAKRAFISKGGLEAIYVLISKAVPVDDNEAGPGPGSRTQEADEFGYKADASAGDEVRALGALVLLQCLTDSPEGQSLILQGRAELLHAVLKMSCSQDMEAEGLKHAALKVLGGWHEEVETRGDIIAKWLQQCAVERTLTPSHPSNSRNQQQNVGQNWNVLLIALQASHHPMLSVRRAAAHLFTAAMNCYRNVQEASEHTISFSVAEEDAISLLNSICCSAADTIAESTAMSSGNVPPRFAQLARTILSPQGGRGDSSYLMMRHQEDARVQRQQVMGLLDLACALLEELEPATTTRNHPKALSTPKATSSALSVGAEASCPTDTHENRSLESVPSDCVEAALPTASPWWLHHTSMINLVLRAFCCAWGLPPPPLSPLPHSSPTSSYDNPEVSQQQLPSALLPFTFSSDPAKADLDRMQQKLAMMLLTGGNKCVDISVAASTGMVVLQDHQVKELALDTLILMLRNQHGLSAIAHHYCASWEDAAHDMGAGKAISREENSVPEVLALRMLHRLILEVLMRETPAHIRAALSLLGALRVNAFSDAWVMQHEKDGATLKTQPGAQSAEKVSKAMAAMVELLGVTCDVFDRAWEAEGLSLDGLMNSNHACAVTTACRQGHHHDMDPSSCLKGHQGGTSLFHNSLGKETGTVKGDTAEFPSMTLHPSTAPKPAGPVFGFPQVTLISPQQQQATSQVPQSVMALSAESAGYKPVERLLKVEMGLGHRVLIQVLQAWKRLSEEGGTGVAAALECLPWWPRVMLASLHDRRVLRDEHGSIVMVVTPRVLRGEHESIVMVVTTRVFRGEHESVVMVVTPRVLRDEHESIVMVVTPRVLRDEHGSIVMVVTPRVLRDEHGSIVMVVTTRVLRDEHESVDMVVTTRVLRDEHGSVVMVVTPRVLRGEHESVFMVVTTRVLRGEHGSVVMVVTTRVLRGEHGSIVMVVTPRVLRDEHGSIVMVVTPRVLRGEHESVDMVVTPRVLRDEHGSVVMVVTPRVLRDEHGSVVMVVTTRVLRDEHGSVDMVVTPRVLHFCKEHMTPSDSACFLQKKRPFELCGFLFHGRNIIIQACRLVSAAAAQIKAPTPQRGVPSAGIRCGFAASHHNDNIDLDSLTGGFEELSLAWASEDTKVQDSSSSCRVLWSNGVRPYPSHVTPQQLQQQKAGGLLDEALGIVGEDEEKRTVVINTSSAPWRDDGGMSCTDTATVLPHDQAFLLPDGLVEDPLLKGEVDAEFAEYLKEVFADCMNMDEEHRCTLSETDQSWAKADVKSSLSISPPLEMDPGTLSILSGNRGRAGCNDEGEGALFEPWSGLLPTSVPPISAVALKEQVVPRSETKDPAKKPLVDLDQPNDGSLGKQSLTTNEALTKVLKSDAELLQEAMEFLPDLDAVADQLCMKYDYFG